jgi:hypothetical protein
VAGMAPRAGWFGGVGKGGWEGGSRGKGAGGCDWCGDGGGGREHPPAPDPRASPRPLCIAQLIGRGWREQPVARAASGRRWAMKPGAHAGADGGPLIVARHYAGVKWWQVAQGGQVLACWRREG